ncbi:MAG TPA: hypothetical protein VNA28_17695 [Solirubrobacteraceae bacterium]|nr:hypothetical protein [Solirubrobacteraceae bacterium]
MPVGQAEEIIALALVFVVHVVGGVMLVWALVDPDQRSGWRRRWGRGDDDPPAPPSGDSDGDGGARVPVELPLPGGGPSRVRLREPARAADRSRRPSRRPAHPAGPAPCRPVPSRES